MEERKVQLKDGEVTLRKLTAGMRNRAIVKADTSDGFKRSLMMIELLPMCVKSHPWGMTPVKDALDRLEIEEYDKLIDELDSMMTPNDDLKKKLNQESDQKEVEKNG
jgi:hypothetical protein